MSGAGSSLITIPVWLTLGFPLPVALASGQINGALWTPIAARNYLRGRVLDFRLLSLLVTFGLIGAYFGTVVIAGVSPEILKRIIGVVILVLVAIALTQRKFGLETAPPNASRLVSGVLALPLGFYEAFFGSGNGIFTSTMLAKTRGFDLLTALGYYYCISVFWNSFAATLYLLHGFGDSSLILPSSIGAVGGAYVGSAIGRKRGSSFVKHAFVALGGLLGLKLLAGW